MERRLWHIEYFIEIGEHHSQRHFIGNYSYVKELLIFCALFDTSSGLIEDIESLLNLSILIFEISSREGALGSFARVNIGSSGLTLIARKGTNVILIAILGHDVSEWKIFFPAYRIARSLPVFDCEYKCLLNPMRYTLRMVTNSYG